MRKIMIFTAVALVTVAGVVLAKGYSGVIKSNANEISVFEMMSTTNDLPAAPQPDAF